MAHLLCYLDDELYVQYGGLCLYGSTDCPEFRDEESEALHYTATLHLEAWDAEPPDPGSSWRPIEQRNFTAETGVIQMDVMEDSGRVFLIGPLFFEYGLTVHVDVVDCGRWLFRFWPIRDVFDPLVHVKPRDPIGSAPPVEPRRVPVPVTTAEHLIPSRPLHEEFDLRVKQTGGTYRMWRASGIVTMLGMDDGRYNVRDAEPHEAARVLCSEEPGRTDPWLRASTAATRCAPHVNWVIIHVTSQVAQGWAEQ
ncbi:hypothetical protein ACQEVF_25835 [Nonomuraea polychroma]|uniref:hypothetical protein n=1 Tax=Nonomuraea polychroma TaxID=46176 RepID=UPI003D8BD201